MSKFDSAHAFLRGALAQISWDYGVSTEEEKKVLDYRRESINSAIRVLEAAAKVDKDDLLASFENICCEARVRGPNVDAIRNLLAALPEEDK